MKYVSPKIIWNMTANKINKKNEHFIQFYLITLAFNKCWAPSLTLNVCFLLSSVCPGQVQIIIVT